MDNTVDLKKLDIKDLKALVYDLLAQKEELQRSETFQRFNEIQQNINVVIQEISIRYLSERSNGQVNKEEIAEVLK